MKIFNRHDLKIQVINNAIGHRISTAVHSTSKEFLIDMYTSIQYIAIMHYQEKQDSYVKKKRQ